MRAISLLVATVGLVHFVAADFYLYLVMVVPTICDPGCDTQNQWYHTAGSASCGEFNGQLVLSDSDDISDDYGVRCEGCELSPNSYPTVVEIHNANVHMTWYANSGLLVDIYNNPVGNCVPWTSHSFSCTNVISSTAYGYSQIFCATGIQI